MRKSESFFEQLAVEVAKGSTITQAAAVCGCQESTAQRVSKHPRFSKRVFQLRTEVSDQAIGRLSAAAIDAVETLRIIATDSHSKPLHRVAAAKAILDSLLQFSENEEVNRRLDELEQNTNSTKVGSPIHLSKGYKY
jgi:hypothetical protein